MALVLVVAATREQTFTRVEIYRGQTLVMTSDGAASHHSILLPSRSPWPQSAEAKKPVASAQLFAVISREDADPARDTITAEVRSEPLTHDTKFEHGTGWFVRSLSDGNAFLYMADATNYERLLTFARCDWVASDARKKSATAQSADAGTPNAASSTGLNTDNSPVGCFRRQMAALRKEIYPFVSSLAGRNPVKEVAEGQPRMSQSEPMVVFFGLGGSNKILLLDCRDADWSGSGGNRERVCSKYSEPWQTTLQRARYVWAMYIEDGQTPFNTSIDAEFKANAPEVDFEEYDPRGQARPLPAEPAADQRKDGQSRLLRIGYRRFRVREPPISIQVAFSRQGPNYGLRQWVRVYRQFSARWWVVAGGIFVPAENNAVSHIELEPVLPPEGGPAVRARIVETFPIAPIYATIVWRWPQVRGLAENQARPSKRLLVNLIPDIAGGLSLPSRRHNSYLVGGSWPILADRLSFITGAKIFRDEAPADGLAVGQFVPASTPIESVRGTPARHVDLIFGLAFELLRSR